MGQRHKEYDQPEVDDLADQPFLDEGPPKLLPLVHDEVSDDRVCEEL